MLFKNLYKLRFILEKYNYYISINICHKNSTLSIYKTNENKIKEVLKVSVEVLQNDNIFIQTIRHNHQCLCEIDKCKIYAILISEGYFNERKH